jgi:excisionase family DNA binding protein
MTVKQAAARLEVSVATTYGLIASGKLRCYRIGNGRGVVRIADEHIAEFLQASAPAAKQLPSPPPPRQITLKHLHS